MSRVAGVPVIMVVLQSESEIWNASKIKPSTILVSSVCFNLTTTVLLLLCFWSEFIQIISSVFSVAYQLFFFIVNLHGIKSIKPVDVFSLCID